MAKIVKHGNKTCIEIPLKSLNNNYKWTILLKHDGNREPVEISDEKRIIANNIIDLLNKESNK